MIKILPVIRLRVIVLVCLFALGCASTKGDCTWEPIPCHEGPMTVEDTTGGN
jgi:hypothetical protein